MESPQSVVSPSVYSEPEKPNFTSFLSKGHEVQSKETDLKGTIGVLEVYIHQARDIQNICIYHKQDVYAKIYLTSDPENTVSTQTINGGGKNPVFNEKLRLNVWTIDSSLKCEIWMLSRVRNYLEDQLLGFALVPMSEVLIKNGKLEKEFSLSSTDLFHSPAGFVKLSLSYSGASPEVIALPLLPAAETKGVRDSELTESLPSELDKIEFPDPKIVNENNMMLSEYFGIQCTDMDSQSSESLVPSDTENQLSSEIGIRVVESFSTGTIESIPKHDSPPSSVSTNGFPSVSVPASSESYKTPGTSKSPNEEYVSPPKENPKGKREDVGDVESVDSFAKPIVTVNIEPEPKMVQQDIVDMYMKSMQQFTESLAKMKLPMDIESGPASSESSSSDQKLPASKNNGSRVFYGSRAFF
ncbi:uncharacterized protein LOC130761127 [Actinidia eriantha]|uniref:uncharacterized protein LOC130761127 n=1 Tax=Actinidia eriantha TaxID=165200 RepID=UPI00258710E9|nr:uncharacterized protein LOC130761127 [Actinidia eriantha]XP_057472584.1 uncharacterized protein LOC130761127 [Actinidia eriantha]XP_057472585.1 uncharacterized protein LOC130761127 [Actinidia eriantha]XP_057472586.1 uncharacterized protein LOC130761127 [Actinidia eriantha]XP_057472587.1 uncharacterized protein LOC130761127 [Actinidia eriantha]